MTDRRRNPWTLPQFRRADLLMIGAGLALLIVLCLLIPGTAAADEYRPELTIQAPAAYVSGAPLDPAELDEYRIYCNGAPAPVAVVVPTGARTEWQADHRAFAPGDHQCFATAVAGGDESGASNTVGFTVSPDRPAPPVLIVVGSGA